jgi:hypothetical protein
MEQARYEKDYSFSDDEEQSAWSNAFLVVRPRERDF